MQHTKKTALVAFILCLVSFVAFAGSSNVRLRSMGGIGIAVSDSRHPAIVNPAALFFMGEDNSFILDTSFQDSFKPKSREIFPVYPETEIKGTFIGKRIALSLGFDYTVENTSSSDATKYYNIYQASEIKIDLTAGIGNFGAGIEIFGGSQKQRLNVPIHENTALSDFFFQTFFASFDRKTDSEYIQINLGFMYKAGEFSFGFMFNDILDNTTSKTSLSWESFISESGFGIYYIRNEYGRRGELNHFGISAGLDVSNIFESSRALHVGLEFSYMLVKNYGFYIRTGYEALFNSFTNGTHTFGIGTKLNNGDFSLSFNFPLSVYRGDSTNDRFSVELAMTLAL